MQHENAGTVAQLGYVHRLWPHLLIRSVHDAAMQTSHRQAGPPAPWLLMADLNLLLLRLEFRIEPYAME